MEVKIDKRNELFKRQELVLELESDKNPSFDETREKIAEKFSKPEENIDVYRIKGNFGKNKFKVEVNIYDSKEDLENIKKLEKTSKQRKEGDKMEEKSEESKESGDEEVKEESKPDSAPVEEKMPEDKLEKKPEEAPIEERPEEEKKAIKENIQKEEETRE